METSQTFKGDNKLLLGFLGVITFGYSLHH